MKQSLCIIAAAEPDKYEENIMATRSRSWRRFQNVIKDKRKDTSKSNNWKPEKKWTLLYTRSVKLHRAKQLGKEYPIKTIHQVIDEND
jgi:hypothetical protein